MLLQMAGHKEIEKLKELVQGVTNSSLNTMRMSGEIEGQLAALKSLHSTKFNDDDESDNDDDENEGDENIDRSSKTMKTTATTTSLHCAKKKLKN